MRRPARGSALVVAAGVVLLLALVAGCGGARDEGPSTGQVGTASPLPTPEEDVPPPGKASGVATRLGPGDPRPRIVCDSDERVGGYFDFVAGAKGEASPESAIEERLDEGDSFVMTEDARTAWVLRPDGTAHTRLSLLHQRGWMVHATHGCAD